MNLDDLKEAIPAEKFAALQAYVTDLIGQRDAARSESIEGRKKLRADLEAARATAAKALEKLGVESPDELDTLPDARGQAEALKQYEARLKRAERERDDAKKLAEEAGGKYRGTLQRAAVSEAMGGHEFVARDLVETYVSQRLTWEGDELLFKTDEGKLVAIKDGVAGLAKQRPELLKPAGTGGAGVRQANAGSSGAALTRSRAEWDSMSHADRASFAKSGGKVVEA